MQINDVINDFVWLCVFVKHNGHSEAESLYIRKNFTQFVFVGHGNLCFGQVSCSIRY